MKGTGWAAAAVVVAMGMAAAAATAQETAKAAQGTTADPKSGATTGRVIVVSLEDRKLALVEDGQVKKIYTVAVGKPSTPSPVGTFTIERRVANPVYHHGGKTVQPGPGNPVGTRWMGLSLKGYGIHGTNAPKSIGKAASHGCIRMAKADLEELFNEVKVGDTVELIGEPNDETAQVFGEPVAPAAQPVLSVSAPVATPVLDTSAGEASKLMAVVAGTR
jgi:lipoprotein-anchoring transpeptidase ErfK/SrfK